MAAVTNAYVPTADTTNGTSYASPSFTPVVGDLLVAFVGATGTVAATPTLTASANSITFTLVSTQAVKNASVDTLYAFVANQLVPSSPSAMTLTFDCSADAATGAIVSCARISGVTKTGSTAIKQAAAVNNVAGGTAPATVFGASAQTGNPTLQAVLTTVGVGSTPPTSWTEQADVTYSTPTTGGGYSSRDSGFTGTTITLGSTANGACCALAVEIDTSASGVSAGSSVPLTHTVTSGGVVGAVASAAVALTFGITAAGVVGTATGSSIPVTDTITSAGVVGTATAATVPLTFGITAAGSVGGASPSAGSSIPLAFGATTAGVVGTSSGATVPLSITVTSGGIVGKASSAPVGLVFAVTTAGTVGTSTGATVSETVTIGSAGQVGSSAAAALTLTTTVTAAGTVGGIVPNAPYIVLTAPARPGTITAPTTVRSLTAQATTRTLTAAKTARTITAPGVTRTIQAQEV